MVDSRTDTPLKMTGAKRKAHMWAVFFHTLEAIDVITASDAVGTDFKLPLLLILWPASRRRAASQQALDASPLQSFDETHKQRDADCVITIHSSRDSEKKGGCWSIFVQRKFS